MKEKIVIITKTFAELEEKYRLFLDLLMPNVAMNSYSQTGGRIETEKYSIRFLSQDRNAMAFRGVRTDILFDLTRDEEFHNLVAMPMLNCRRR